MQSADFFSHLGAIDQSYARSIYWRAILACRGVSMRRACFTMAAILCSAVAMYANPIPTFNLTQGSISVTFVGPGIPVPVDFGFTGPNGVSVSGTGTISSASCLGFVLAGD